MLVMILRWKGIAHVGCDFVAASLAAIDTGIIATAPRLMQSVVSGGVVLIEIVGVLILGHCSSLVMLGAIFGQALFSQREKAVDRKRLNGLKTATGQRAREGPGGAQGEG